MPGYAIEANHLMKSYGGSPVVHDLTLQIEQGSIYGLLGPNGAGKSTTIAMLTGLLRPDSGTVSILGQPMHPEAIAVRQLMGVVPDNLALFEYLSIWDNLEIIREAWSIRDDIFTQRAEDLLQILNISNDAQKQVRHCSYGMKKKVSLAMALLPNPKILILDEPFEGLDPIMSRTVEASLRRAAQRGITVLITTHVLTSIDNLLHRFGILKAGRLVASGDLATLRRTGQTLHEAYLREFSEEALELTWLG